MAKSGMEVSDINKISYKKLIPGECYTTHRGVKQFQGAIDNYKMKDGTRRKVWVFAPLEAGGRRTIYGFESVTKEGRVLKALLPGMECDYKGYLVYYKGFDGNYFIFTNITGTGEEKMVQVPFKDMQEGTLIIDSKPKKARKLASPDEEVKDIQYHDFGKKIPGARKDLYDVKTSEIMRMSGYVRDQKVNRKGLIGDGTEAFWQELLNEKQDKRLVALLRKIYYTIPKAPVYKIDDTTGLSLTDEEKKPYQEQYINYCRKVWGKAMSFPTYESFRAKKWTAFLIKQGYLVTRENKDGEMCIKGVNHDYDLYRPTIPAMYLCTKYMPGMKGNEKKIDEYIKEKKLFCTAEEKKLSNYLICTCDKLKIYEFKNGRVKICIDTDDLKRAYLITEGDFKKITKGDIKADNTWFLADDTSPIAIGVSTEEEAKQIALAKYDMLLEKKRKKAEQTGRRKRLPAMILKETIRIKNGKETPITKMTPITTDKFKEDFNLIGGEYGNWETQEERKDNTTHAYWALSDLTRATGLTKREVTFRKKLYIGFGSRGVPHAAAHYEPADNVINLTRMKGAGTLGHEWFHAFDYNVGRQFGYPSLSHMYENNPSALPEPFIKLFEAILYAHDEDGCPQYELDSSFMQDAKMMDTCFYTMGMDYWCSLVELFARAGHCYLYDKLKETNSRNDYLNGTCNRKVVLQDLVVHLGTEGETRKRINKCFDDVFKYVKENKII